MRLTAWREIWMWLAVSACGGTPAWMTAKSPHPVSIMDAPPLAGARYVALVEDGDFGNPGPRVSFERGPYECARLVDRQRGSGQPDDPAQAPTASCDPELVTLLRTHGGFVFLVDAGGRRWVSAHDLVTAALPIDTPAKALLVAWASGRYEMGWTDGEHSYGGLLDGIVRTVPGGFEVIGGAHEETSTCGSANPSESVTNLRVTVFVDPHGAIAERERVATHHYEVSDPCHPMGRRPADFADVRSHGTLRGHLRRAMHHEAESVRAFERIARELRAYGAPDELCVAAAQAACDEREHARRCAELAGVQAVIARDALPVRSLVDLAIENAREGCVGESYAALVNVVQARTAETAELRAHFAAIASDELAHAALAHAIAAWLDGVLSPAERARVHAATERALGDLSASLATTPTAATRALGLPDDALAGRLLDAVASCRISPATAATTTGMLAG